MIRKGFLLSIGAFVLISVGLSWSAPVKPVQVPEVHTPSQRPEHGWSTSGEIVDVHDGDTITVKVTRLIRVRLRDCWAPEVTGVEKPFGIESRNALHDIALGKPCTLYVPTEQAKDFGDIMTFDRMVGIVWTADDAQHSLNDTMVTRGYATKTKEELKTLLRPR